MRYKPLSFYVFSVYLVYCQIPVIIFANILR